MKAKIDNLRSFIDKTAQFAESAVRLLYERKITLAAAESCTGGLLSGSVTGVSGSSGVFGIGVCCYSNEMKERLLGVSPLTIAEFGAVSAECAAEMANGIRKLSGADVGISVTGIAGPGGGENPEKPVGTVFIACSRAGNYKIKILHLKIANNDNREAVRLESVRQALILLLNTI